MATSTIGKELERRQQRPARQLTTFADDFSFALLQAMELAFKIRFPCTEFQSDPARFARDILGLRPWAKQIAILEAIRDHSRVAVRSGHKVGKSTTAAIAALWWYCSYQDARAIMTSTTSRQVDAILWRELRMLKARGGRCVECKDKDPDGLLISAPCEHSALIDGEIGDMARTGLKSSNFREVVGFTAREAEAVAGISGARLLYLVDEASGVPDVIFEAIEGNRAGGGKLAMFSNPTRNDGEFYDAFNSKARFYITFTVSSEESPNVVAGKVVIPGMCERDYITLKEEEWGRESALFMIRVLGLHAEREEGKIFPVAAITAAEARWYDTPESGRLFIGLDPAGETGMGDETLFALRRGLRLLSMHEFRGMNDEQHLGQLLYVIKENRLPRETPVVVLDREGSIGAALLGKLRNYLDTPGNEHAFELVAVRASDKAHRQPQLYDRVRDELCANLESWFRDGGAIPEDPKLAKELHALEWQQQKDGKLKILPKRELKKLLGRSPDRYDAVALSAWEPLSLRVNADAPTSVREIANDAHAAETFDPYEALEVWKQ